MKILTLVVIKLELTPASYVNAQTTAFLSMLAEENNPEELDIDI